MIDFNQVPKTLPHVLLHNAKTFPPSKTAMREKDYGIWQSYSWQDYLAKVKCFALGLASLGFKRDDKMAIVGDNRPELYWAAAACQCLGGVPVPLYQDAIEKELHYILDHSESRFAMAEDQEQSDKLMSLRGDIPRLEYIFFDDPRGMRNYSHPWLLAFDHVQELGRQFERDHPTYFEDEISKGKPDDLSVITYTSGTTGNPKGVMLTYRAIIDASMGFIEWEQLTDKEEIMAYLPMAWIGDHIFSYGQAMCAGFTINCPESTSTVMHDQKEIGPTHIFAPPRIWENILTQVMIKMEDAAWVKRKMFHFFLNVANRVEKAADEQKAGASVAEISLRARGVPRIQAPVGQPGHAASAARLHGGRGYRTGDFRILQVLGNQSEATLWHDGELRLRLHPEDGRDRSGDRWAALHRR